MWDNWIGNQIRRCNRNLLRTSLVILAALALTAGGFRRYVKNFILGPYPTSLQGLESVNQPGDLDHYYVSLHADKLLDTGMEFHEKDSDTGADRGANGRLMITKGDQRYFIVKVGMSDPGHELRGAVIAVPSDVRQALDGSLFKGHDTAWQKMAPCMIDATDFRTPGYWALGIGSFFLAIAIALGLQVLKRRNFEQHPTFRALATRPQPFSQIQQIETEVQAADAQKIGSALLTRSWLFHISTFWCKPVRLEDIVWAYKKVTKHYHSFIPTGKTYEALVFDRARKTHAISLRQANVDALLVQLAARAPWAVFGFSKERQQLWSKHPAEFIRQIDERRKPAAKTVEKLEPVHA